MLCGFSFDYIDLNLTPAQRPALPAAGENQLTKRDIAIVQNQLKKRAESQPSGARFVGHFMERKTHDLKEDITTKLPKLSHTIKGNSNLDFRF